MPPKKKAFELDDISNAIPNIFDQAQTSTATHKKNCVSLYKLHCGAASFTESGGRGRHQDDVKLIGEKVFADTFVDMLSRVLVVKKGIPSADRIVKFVGAYAKFLFEKSSSDDQGGSDSTSSRFLSRVLKYLMKGTTSKSKNVRYRVVALISEIIVYIGEIDQDVYNELRSCLLERLHDKESLVRANCAIALCKLSASEDPEEVEEDEPILSHLMGSLLYDPATEVRRAILVHLPFLPTTLPSLLTRMRDVDALTRKLVYSTVLPRLAHPKQLTISQREGVVKHGLGDREEAVRVAAAKLLGSWVDTCEGSLKDFLRLFDVSSTEISTDALKSIFVMRAEIVNELEFDDAFWSNLSPETALLVRIFVEHCIDTKDQSKLESSLPVVTALAFQVQSQFNRFLALFQETEEAKDLNDQDTEELDNREDQMADVELILNEILQLAAHLDYSDEIGRRKMFGVVREMIAHSLLPDSLVKPCVGVLEVMSTNERDLVRQIVEIISEIRDAHYNQADEEMALDGNISSATATTQVATQQSDVRTRRTFNEMTAEEKMQADIADLRCLNLCVEVLEKVNGSFEENSTLEGILADLIIPAVKRKELALRAKGLISLGLCCLIAKNMAMNSFQLFLNQIKSSPEPLRIKVLQIVFDIIMSYDKELSVEKDVGQRVTAFLMQVLEAEESNAVQAVICLGFAKLMLYGLVTDERVLLCLVMAYVSPMTTKNQELRQCLAYFLPVYCYSSAENQDRMRSLFVTAYDVVKRMHEDLETGQDMIAPIQFGELFIDWTDPSKSASSSTEQYVTSTVHLNLAIDILKALYDSDRTDEDKRIFCQLLGKLALPENAGQETLYSMHILCSYLNEQCPLDDTAAEKTFSRFVARFSKVYTSQVDEFDEHECFGKEEYHELYEFMGVSIPRKGVKKAKASKPSCAKSTSREDSASDEEEGESAQDKPKGKHPSTQADSEDDVGTSEPEDTDNSLVQSDSDYAKDDGRRAKRNEKNRYRRAAAEASDDDEDPSDFPEPERDRVRSSSPTTPVKSHKSVKRLHTPSKTPSMASPAHKRVKSTTRQRRSKVETLEPMSIANRRTNRTDSKPTRQPPQTGMKQWQTVSTTEPSDSSDHDSDGSVLSRIPRVKERMGWDASSDI